MDLTFDKLVLLERMELIARLTTTVECHERDKEIALMMIAEIAQSILDTDIVQNQNRAVIPHLIFLFSGLDGILKF